MSADEELAPSRNLVLPILGALLHGILAAGLLVFFMTGVSGAKKTFDEYGMTLPWLTLQVIRVSNALADFWWPLALLLPFAVVGDFLVLRYTDRRTSLTWFIVATVVLFLVISVCILAIELPMMKLRAALSK